MNRGLVTRCSLLTLFVLALTSSNVFAEPFKATIVRDGFGVPYIIADSVADAAFGDGYAQAQDRLKLVMNNIQTATGTRAAQLGPGQVERDYRARMTGARRTAYAKWDAVPEDVRRVLEGFAAGINQYLDDATGPLPPTARRVEPQEILATLLFGGLYRQMSQAQKDLRGMGKNPIAGEGSNGAVLAPSRSTSGEGLLLCDPHTPWQSHNRWYEKHYVTPQVEAHGFCTTGLPLFLFCVTDRIAWTLTRNPGDRGDCFILKANPDNPRQYLFDGEYQNVEVVEERIEVKGQDAVVRPVAITVHGPVIKRGKGRFCAAGMSMFGEVGVSAQLYAALVSRNLDDFKKASAMRQADGGNIFYTDVDGNIYYAWWNRLNIRNDRYNWTSAVDGSTRDSLYQGILPFEKMPQSTNDTGGYYQASNAADWTLEQGAWGMAPSDFPNWLLTSPKRTTLPARSQRIVDLITGTPKHTLEGLLKWSLDTRILGADWSLPLIERAYKELGNGGDVNVDQAMAVLIEWKKNPVATKESKGYSVYREWLDVLKKGKNIDRHWGVLAEVADIRNVLSMLPEHPELVPDEVVKRVHDALLQAVKSLVSLHGTPTPQWGDINVIELADGTCFPSGAADSMSQGIWQNSQAPKRGADGKWRCVAGSDGMMMAEMTSPPRVFTMVPYGQSADPKSPHFADQTERYTNGEYKRAWFTREAILAHAESQLSISTKANK
ncbi:MAG: hypothetical protein GWP08_12435 [Nitrospiraceae bacterium]|nr:hypothetical protein [Nitrospiraceae bacterium]